MNITKEAEKNCTNEEYREKLKNIFEGVEDNRILKYFYIFVLEKLKRVL